MSQKQAKRPLAAEPQKTSMFPSLKKTFYIPSNSKGVPTVRNRSFHNHSLRMTSHHPFHDLGQHLTESTTGKMRQTFLRQSEERSCRKVGQYRIIRELGKGGFAHVYEVENSSRHKFAMKEYDLDVALECFHNETVTADVFWKDGKLREEFEEH